MQQDRRARLGLWGLADNHARPLRRLWPGRSYTAVDCCRTLLWIHPVLAGVNAARAEPSQLPNLWGSGFKHQDLGRAAGQGRQAGSALWGPADQLAA